MPHIIEFDLENNELTGFPWFEDWDPPLIVKGKVRREERDPREERKN